MRKERTKTLNVFAEDFEQQCLQAMGLPAHLVYGGDPGTIHEAVILASERVNNG